MTSTSPPETQTIERPTGTVALTSVQDGSTVLVTSILTPETQTIVGSTQFVTLTSVVEASTIFITSTLAQATATATAVGPPQFITITSVQDGSTVLVTSTLAQATVTASEFITFTSVQEGSTVLITSTLPPVTVTATSIVSQFVTETSVQDGSTIFVTSTLTPVIETSLIVSSQFDTETSVQGGSTIFITSTLPPETATAVTSVFVTPTPPAFPKTTTTTTTPTPAPTFACSFDQDVRLSPNNVEYGVACGRDTGGLDVGTPYGTTNSVESFEECLGICDVTLNCLGFTWVGGPNSYGNGVGTCYFKAVGPGETLSLTSSGDPILVAGIRVDQSTTPPVFLPITITTVRCRSCDYDFTLLICVSRPLRLFPRRYDQEARTAALPRLD